MRSFLHSLGVLFALLVLSAPVAWAADPDAKAFLEGIYAAYIGEPSEGVWYSTEEEAAKIFTPELAALIVADMSGEEGLEIGALDFDPFINGQDWYLEAADIAVEETGPGTAVGEARFTNIDRAMVVRYDLVETADGWRIDDIHWDDYEFSLREILQTSTE